MDSTELQQEIFAGIRATYKGKGEFLEEMLELFGTTRSTFYKKVRGETKLTTDELLMLAERFDIDFNGLFGSGQENVRFTVPAIDSKKGVGGNFLEAITQDFSILQGRKETKFFYITRELPIFHYFYSPELAAFKFYVYQNSVWMKASKSMIPFEVGVAKVPSSVMDMIHILQERYAKIDSIEIWSDAVFVNTMKQIEYFLDAKLFFQPTEAIHLSTSLLELLGIMEEMALLGKKYRSVEDKSPEGSLKVYYHELLHVNNTVLVDAPEYQAVYLTHDNPNFMKTTDVAMVEWTKAWIVKLKRKSQLLTSGDDEVLKNYFGQLRTNLLDWQKRLRAKIAKT